MQDDLKAQIRTRYAEAARSAATGDASCCGTDSSCCGDAQATSQITSQLYALDEVTDLPAEAMLASLGCGNPTALAEILPGEVVLDLGSGGGIDVLLSAKRVGPTGKAYGLDMTDEMLALARENQRKAGATNVEFLKGDIEAVPLPANAVDLIISNCVINLSTDKDQVLREAFRVLRPGGRLAVSDVIFQGDIDLVPQELRQSVSAWAGCIAGALEEREYLVKLKAAGFQSPTITVTRVYEGDLAAMLPEGIRLASGFIRARKPGTGPWAIRKAAATDLPAVHRLLRERTLPLEGLQDQFGKGYAVAEAEGRIIGVAGMEVYGRNGLLRSVATDQAWQGQGLAEVLTRDRLAWARQENLASVWLLTTSAGDYFSRFGFAPAERTAAPALLQGSVEFASACPDSALALRLSLR